MKSTARATGEGGGWAGARPRALLAIAARPWLWRHALALVPPRWWARHPHLPVPPAAYRRFRSETMYGDAGEPAGSADLVAYLEWCRRMRQRAR